MQLTTSPGLTLVVCLIRQFSAGVTHDGKDTDLWEALVLVDELYPKHVGTLVARCISLDGWKRIA